MLCNRLLSSFIEQVLRTGIDKNDFKDPCLSNGPRNLHSR